MPELLNSESPYKAQTELNVTDLMSKLKRDVFTLDHRQKQLSAGAPSSSQLRGGSVRQKAEAGLQLHRESTGSSFSHWSKSHGVHTINSEDGLRKPQIMRLFMHIGLTVPCEWRFFSLTYVYNNHRRLLLYVYVILINLRNKGQ